MRTAQDKSLCSKTADVVRHAQAASIGLHTSWRIGLLLVPPHSTGEGSSDVPTN
jgi:hypothetical protein